MSIGDHLRKVQQRISQAIRPEKKASAEKQQPTPSQAKETAPKTEQATKETTAMSKAIAQEKKGGSNWRDRILHQEEKQARIDGSKKHATPAKGANRGEPTSQSKTPSVSQGKSQGKSQGPSNSNAQLGGLKSPQTPNLIQEAAKRHQIQRTPPGKGRGR